MFFNSIFLKYLKLNENEDIVLPNIYVKSQVVWYYYKVSIINNYLFSVWKIQNLKYFIC